MKGQPFFFDEHIFDEDDPRQDAVEEDVQKPEFTQDELKAARDAAYQEGVKAGYAQSEADLSQKMLDILQQAHNKILILLTAEDQRAELYEAEAVHLSFQIIKKSFPLLEKTFDVEQLKNRALDVFSTYKDVSQLQVHCAPDLSKPLQDFLEQNAPDISSRVSFVEDASFSDTQCHVLWTDGGVILNQNQITQKIFTIMEQTLAERGIHSHDSSDHAQEETGVAHDHIKESN